MRIHPFQNRRLLLALAIAVLICQSSIARAATTRTVTSNFDGSSGGTLRDAIMASDNGDTINFSVTGAIFLTGGPLVISKDITITGPGANVLEVTRGGTPSDFRIFQIDGGNVSISGLTVSNGFASGGLFRSYGGAIRILDANLTITNCVITRNTAQYGGGGIAIFDNRTSATLTVNNCSLTGNGTSDPSFGQGGAIYANGSVTIRNSTLSGNSSQQGGAIYTLGSFPAVAVSGSTITGNSAGTSGGGIYSDSGTLTLSNCTLTNNSASTGGGIYNVGNRGTASVTMSNSTLSGNSASNGGGIYNVGQSGNNAFVMLNNTILQTGAAGANLVNVGLGTSITSQGYNLSNDNGGGFLTAGGDQINKNPQLGLLQDNGGPTFTMALLPGSPALDKGKNFGVTTDQRGLPRPKDLPSVPNASGGDGSDIGAVEMQALPAFIVTTLADHDDGTCSPDDCTLREAINLANAAPGPDTITFAGGLTGTIILGPGLGTLTVTDSLTITGPGARVLAVSGNNVLRVFYFGSGANVMSGLTIRDGAATAAAGTGNGTAGGGVFNSISSTLFVTNCSFSNNHVQGADNATAAGVGGRGWGGGIGNSGVVTLIGCTLSGNGAAGGRGGDGSGAIGGNVHGGNGGDGLGGAIFNDTNARLEIVNSTIATNSATGGPGGNGQFGGNGGAATAGVFNNGMMTVTAATLSNNGATGGAGGKGSNNFNGGSIGVARGGLATGSGTSVVRDTISAGNVGNGGAGSDAGGAFSSEGYNLIGAGDASTGFNATGDQLGTSAAPVIAKLGTLQNNSGATNTVALLSGSPAIDAGKAFGLSTDQRGLGRVVGTAVVSGGDGSDIGAFEVQPTPTPTPGLVANVSTRLPVGTGDNVLIEGFVVQGPAGSTKKIIVRAIGPFLASFGITDALANPTLEIHDANNNNAIVATNDNWKVTQLGGLITADQSAEITASGFAPSNDLEAAIIANLPPGSYTAVVRGVGNSVGTGVVDAYDLSAASSARLVNFSTRGLIQPGDKLMIAGFITQSGSVRAVVRAIGPSLAAFGITNALADTTLQLRDTNGAIVVENDDWKIRSNGTSQQAEIEATGLQPTDDREAVVLATLPPGQYTAQVRGKPETTGIGVVQVYFLQ